MLFGLVDFNFSIYKLYVKLRLKISFSFRFCIRKKSLLTASEVYEFLMTLVPDRLKNYVIKSC